MTTLSTARFAIFIRTAEGVEIEAFTWTRDAMSGIRRAEREGEEFGHRVVAAWAVPLTGDYSRLDSDPAELETLA